MEHVLESLNRLLALSYLLGVESGPKVETSTHVVVEPLPKSRSETGISVWHLRYIHSISCHYLTHINLSQLLE